MIDVGCRYYVGDEDCHKCLLKGLLFDCSGCVDAVGGEKMKDEVKRDVSVDDVIGFMTDKAVALREEVNYMYTHGEDRDKIEECLTRARYYESTVRFLQNLKQFENGLDEYIRNREEQRNV